MKKQDQHQEEKEKKFLLWSAITFFMMLIFSLWIFNMGDVLKEIEQKNPEIAQEIEGGEEMQGLVDNISQEFDKLKDFTPSRESDLTTTTEQKKDNNSKHRELLKKLKKNIEQEKQ